MLPPDSMVTFQSFPSGPLWNFSKMGDNLRARLVRKGMSFFPNLTLNFQKTIRETLKVDLTEENKDKSEQDIINKDNSEIDLLSVISTDSQKVVLQAETKSNMIDSSATVKCTDDVLRKDINKGGRQLEHFKDHLQRMHGAEVKNFWYLPAVALPNISRSLLLQLFPNLPYCFCSKDMPVVEIEISGSKLEPGVPLHQGYQGKKYHVCRNRIQGGGCSFFKWDCDKSSQSSCDPDTENCWCLLKPISVEIPPEDAKKSQKKAFKRFQVCQKNSCNFFRWLNENATLPSCKNAKTREQKFGNFCSRHFLLEDHITKADEQRLWWEESCREHRQSNTPATSDSLKMRLLTIASMAFSQIPRLVSCHTSDSMLILMK